MFGEKYDDVVRVVDVAGISMELCGGEGEAGVGVQVYRVAEEIEARVGIHVHQVTQATRGACC